VKNSTTIGVYRENGAQGRDALTEALAIEIIDVFQPSSKIVYQGRCTMNI